MIRVSIVVPCYNEQRTIAYLLSALYKQDFPLNDMEVVIADGMSTDNTRGEIDTFYREHPEIKISVIDNVKRIIPSGLNLAIMFARGEYIVRLDAHSMPNENYITRCVRTLDEGRAENVGGVWEIKPGADNFPARSIALAASHRLGVGDARYRYTNKAEFVDTVPFGAFRRELIDRIGPFDETLQTNEDYEFNTRIRQAGGMIWLDPEIKSIYFARATYSALAKQYWRYGFWKVRMLRKYPGSIRWRQALPPLFILSLIGLGLLSLFSQVALYILCLELVLYVIILIFVGVEVALKNRQLAVLFGVPAAIATMHITWGSAFLWSSIRR